jgi:uncharacterized RDD family membrane protein YckC
MSTSLPLASLLRRFASLVYETLILLALWFVSGFLVVGLMPEAPRGGGRLLYQIYLLVVSAAYCLWFWRRGGQTLAMRTWRVRLVDVSGLPVSPRQAWLRFFLAALGTLGLGFGFVWALWDKERLFLHDRLAGTRLVELAPLHVPKAGDGDQGEDRQGQ